MSKAILQLIIIQFNLATNNVSGPALGAGNK